ncbi:MAG: 50S ribosomal protein L28 [Firmicutes bacterium]|nr:50S ribosomal protein L28 [Bacillota bacterium]
MARVCVVCNKGTRTGNAVSHSMRATKRTWRPNLQKIRVTDNNGATRRAYVCTRCLKSGKVTRAL